VAQLAPANVDVSIYRGLAELPPFNPDIERDFTPEAVTRFWTRLEACDAVLISSPEYAHGVPGVLKNALDWVVGSGELTDKPIALINASGRATHAWASLRETLTVMSARVIVAASITIPLDGRRLGAGAIAGDTALSSALRSALEALAQAVRYRAFSRESRIGGHVIVVQVSVRAKPDNVERLEQILQHVVGEARQAPGCLRYDWYRSPDAERELFVYAEFDSEEAFAQYRKGSIVKKIGEQLIPLLEARPSFKHFSATVLEQS
jgi:chromate reductase